MSIINGNDRNSNGANGGGHARKRLIAEIVSRSVAKSWQKAREEWLLTNIFIAPEPGTCLCGQYPINEQCELVNRRNGNRVFVGNICVTKFLGINSEGLFKGFRRIIRKPAAALTEDAIEFAYSKNWVNNWERGFYLNTHSMRSLSPNRKAKRVQINEKILRRAREGHGNA
jgi:hypothetical protein